MPIFRRFGRPGLLGAVAATAVVAGTATMTSRAINNSMNRRAATVQEAAPAPPVEPTLTDQLQTLSQLHASGQIDDDEFAAAKSHLLAG
jgi:hypothetical protein